MVKEIIEINNKTRIIILWPLIQHRWEDIVNFISGIVKIKDKIVISQRDGNDKDWFDLIFDLYLSHLDSDNLHTREEMIFKINKKIKLEYFGNIESKNRNILILTYDIGRDSKNKIMKNVRSICKHNDDRIEENKRIKKLRNHCYYQNTLKDIVRNKFKNDKNLPEHERGIEYGKKRIAHCPESASGVKDIINFAFKKNTKYYMG